MAKKAVDSTLRRILNYTAEIIASIFLLVIICIPLAFVIPMWFQTVALGAPRNQLSLDPVHWFGFDGAAWLTLLLGLVSFVLGYFYILKMKPGVVSTDEEEEIREIEEAEVEDVEEEEQEEVIEEIDSTEAEEVIDEEFEEESEELLDDEANDDLIEYED